MNSHNRSVRTIRLLLSASLVFLGLSVAWAWGQVARLAESQAADEEPALVTLYAAWKEANAKQATLFCSTDEGNTWQLLALPVDAGVVTWAEDGSNRLAVALDDGSVLRSEDQGHSWATERLPFPVLSLAWDKEGRLYLGTEGRGVYRLMADGSLANLAAQQPDLASATVRHLALAEGRLFAATPIFLYATDDLGRSWVRSSPVQEQISALAVVSKDQVFVGTEIAGIYKSDDTGQTWEMASDGLGLAAGQMVRITALRVDPQVPGVLYAAVDHLVGSTQVHASAAGTFVTVDGGTSWLPLAGAAFPEAQHVTGLVLVPGKPLYVQAVTTGGLQGYVPDIEGALTDLQNPDPQARATAARILGLARAPEAGHVLLAALADPQPAVSLAASEALGYLADPAMVDELLLALDHPSESVRLGAARALGMMRVEAAVEPLRAMLLHGQGLAVTTAAQALARIGSPAAIEALLATLTDPELTPRWHAAMAGLESAGESAVAPLTALLHSEDEYIRRNAAQALGWIGSPAATAALARTLRTDRDTTVREQAAWALGEIGDPAARTALEHAWSRDAEPGVRTTAGWALARLSPQPVTTARWPATWAPVFSQLEAVRWLILTTSLLGAAWLARGQIYLRPILLGKRIHRN
ncbi:MAG: HEAT repeat domain-containing protein [Anaerolineae bacterium]